MARYFSGRLIGIHLFTITAVITCLWLGKWQWDRAHATVELPSSAGITDFALLSPLRDYLPPSSVGVATVVSGTWQPNGRIVLTDRPSDGSKLISQSGASISDSGVWVLDILTLQSGGSLGVVHSWLPNAQDIPELSGDVKLSGVMQPSELLLQTTETQIKNYLTTELIVSKANSTVHDGYFVSTKPIIGTQNVLPIFDQPQETKLQWRNVIYTGNWIIFAVIIAAMWWRIIQDEVAQSKDKQVVGG